MAALKKTATILASLFLVVAGVPEGRLRAGEADDPLVEMVMELVKDSDHDMFALGLQQVREEVPGAAVTGKLVGLLPELAPDRRAGLLEALGERGDPAARPAVLKMLDAPEPVVRAAAITALGGLGGASDVPRLARRAASGAESERAAARRALIRLAGPEVNRAMIVGLGKAPAPVRVELLGILAARNATEALGAVEEAARDPDPRVRLAALGAVRYLADPSRTRQVVRMIREARSEAEREKAELALLTLCSRGGEACAGAILQGLEEAPGTARVALLRALARAGGPAALPTLVAHLDDELPEVREEAVRLLARWPTREAIAPLRKLAQPDRPLRDHVVALRGLVRLADAGDERPADRELLADVLRLARRPQEKQLALGALGRLDSPEALALVAPLLDDPAVGDEAALAAVQIAERIEGGAKDPIRAVMEKIRDRAGREELRQRAASVLDSLK